MSKKPEDAGSDPLSGLLTLAIAASVMVVICAAFLLLWYVYQLHMMEWDINQGTLGQLGDFFGGLVNPMVGLVTVLLILLSISIQRRELQSSLRELKQSNEALAAQNAAIALQSFEQAFFAWLTNYRDLVSSTTYKGHAGSEALRLMWNEQLGETQVRALLNAVLPPQDYEEAIKSGRMPDAMADEKRDWLREALRRSWDGLYSQSKHHFDSIFRTLYLLVRWVDEQQLSSLRTVHYIDIVQAQLSTVELKYLFYSGFTDRGRRFATYINKYALFKNLDESNDFGIQFMKRLDESPFEAEAFNADLTGKS